MLLRITWQWPSPLPLDAGLHCSDCLQLLSLCLDKGASQMEAPYPAFAPLELYSEIGWSTKKSARCSSQYCHKRFAWTSTSQLEGPGSVQPAVLIRVRPDDSVGRSFQPQLQTIGLVHSSEGSLELA